MSAEIPELSGFQEIYGIKVSAIGEDGDLIALGHHKTLYALAAFTGYAVDVMGLQDLYDGSTDDPGSKASAAIKQGWAGLVTACDEAGEEDHQDDCCECIEIREHAWYLEVGDKEVPNSFPVTYFTA